jgi:hypothetical protein
MKIHRKYALKDFWDKKKELNLELIKKCSFAIITPTIHSQDGSGSLL